MAKCNICGETLKRSSRNECAGQGDFYHSYEVYCENCGIRVKGDDYYTNRSLDERAPIFEKLEVLHDQKTRDILQTILKSCK